jgi:hypothetical protein
MNENHTKSQNPIQIVLQNRGDSGVCIVLQKQGLRINRNHTGVFWCHGGVTTVVAPTEIMNLKKSQSFVEFPFI